MRFRRIKFLNKVLPEFRCLLSRSSKLRPARRDGVWIWRGWRVGLSLVSLGEAWWGDSFVRDWEICPEFPKREGADETDENAKNFDEAMARGYDADPFPAFGGVIAPRPEHRDGWGIDFDDGVDCWDTNWWLTDISRRKRVSRGSRPARYRYLLLINEYRRNWSLSSFLATLNNCRCAWSIRVKNPPFLRRMMFEKGPGVDS